MPFTRSAREREGGIPAGPDDPKREITRFSPDGILSVVLAALVFALTALALAQASREPNLPDVDLPIMAAGTAAPIEESFVVTVSTANPGLRVSRGEWSQLSLGTGDCHVYVHDQPVNSDELNELAFDRLDRHVLAQFDPMVSHSLRSEYDGPIHLPFQIRADASTPWRCIGGVIFAAEHSGYPEVSFLTHPVRP